MKEFLAYSTNIEHLLCAMHSLGAKDSAGSKADKNFLAFMEFNL